MTDPEFTRYIDGIVNRHRRESASVLSKKLGSTVCDFRQEAWIAISKAWKARPFQTAGYYAKAVDFYFDNLTRTSSRKKRNPTEKGKIIPEALRVNSFCEITPLPDISGDGEEENGGDLPPAVEKETYLQWDMARHSVQLGELYGHVERADCLLYDFLSIFFPGRCRFFIHKKHDLADIYVNGFLIRSVIYSKKKRKKYLSGCP